ncbi:hypothetical protein FS837_002505 [Tulasnella sp. UAMH 9824]|nr:hypothetical protein FS837_002505 [Tulasnella sp. UAMH 9824]
MSQQSSQSQAISGNPRVVPASSRLSATPTLIPPNSLTGKRLVFASPVPPPNSSNHAITSLRILLSKTETSFDKLSLKLNDLASAVKYGQKEMAELNQIQQDDLAEVKRDLQEHVSKAQVAIQSSFSAELQFPRNDFTEALNSVSSRLDHLVSKFSSLEETLNRQTREQGALWERLRLMTRELDKASNNGGSLEEPYALDRHLSALKTELLQSIHSEFSKLSERILTPISPLTNKITPVLPVSLVYDSRPSATLLDPDLGTNSTLPASTDATIVHRPISPLSPHVDAPGTLSSRYLLKNKLYDDISGLQEIDLPPAQITAHLAHSDSETKKVSHLHRQKTRNRLPPVYSNHRHPSPYPTATTKDRSRRIRSINDEAIGDLPPVDGFA